ncbi:MAG: GNAT family N-acetyltransferase [Opitutaceae bacterium]|jgi:GNAT superfamily N-acetyltransferase
MNLEPLYADTLLATQQIAVELFPWECEHQEALSASLAPHAHADFYNSRGLDSVRCWTAMRQGSVEGMAMLYGYKAQIDEVWLAWFGLRASARGCGAGAMLLDGIISNAREEGRRVMRLWTTDESEYAAAVRMYQRRGFKPEMTTPLQGETWSTMVFSLGLDGQIPAAWSSVRNRGELCGREAPEVHAHAFAA